MDEEGVRLLCLLLRPSMTVLEFGAGGSTTLFRLHSNHIHERVAIGRKYNIHVRCFGEYAYFGRLTGA